MASCRSERNQLHRLVQHRIVVEELGGAGHHWAGQDITAMVASDDGHGSLLTLEGRAGAILGVYRQPFSRGEKDSFEGKLLAEVNPRVAAG